MFLNYKKKIFKKSMSIAIFKQFVDMFQASYMTKPLSYEHMNV